MVLAPMLVSGFDAASESSGRDVRSQTRSQRESGADLVPGSTPSPRGLRSEIARLDGVRRVVTLGHLGHMEGELGPIALSERRQLSVSPVRLNGDVVREAATLILNRQPNVARSSQTAAATTGYSDEEWSILLRGPSNQTARDRLRLLLQLIGFSHLLDVAPREADEEECQDDNDNRAACTRALTTTQSAAATMGASLAPPGAGEPAFPQPFPHERRKPGPQRSTSATGSV
jgi:hypothetical protein